MSPFFGKRKANYLTELPDVFDFPVDENRPLFKVNPGTASGVMFVSLEDETGTSNVVIWNSTQERYRTEILTGKLLIIKGKVEILADGVAVPVVHVIAGHIQNVTDRLQNIALKSRDFH